MNTVCKKGKKNSWLKTSCLQNFKSITTLFKNFNCWLNVKSTVSSRQVKYLGRPFAVCVEKNKEYHSLHKKIRYKTSQMMKKRSHQDGKKTFKNLLNSRKATMITSKLNKDKNLKRHWDKI